MMAACFPALDPASYRPHALHAAERAWPETNCYVDLWIEVLNALKLPPEAVMGFTVTQDFEGDQLTFFKIPTEDLESLFGLRVQELAIFDRTEEHVAEQVRRGRLCLVELDSFFLPDTQGVSYRTEHGKTTVAINRIDIAARRLDYFHNAGFFRLEGEDFDGLFRLGPFAAPEGHPFLPYTEFVKLTDLTRPDDLPGAAVALLRRHLKRRPAENPIAAYAQAFPAQAAALAERPQAYFHKYAFNTLRQLGANYELLASHLDWLAAHGHGGTQAAREGALAIANTAKTLQFQLARAVARRKFDGLGALLAPAAQAWDAIMADLDARFG